MDTATSLDVTGRYGDAAFSLRYVLMHMIEEYAALAAARRSGDHAVEGRALNNRGIAYQELRRFEEAIDYCQQSLAIFQETGDRHGEGVTLANLGTAYAGLRRLKEAIECTQESLAIFQETGDRHGEGQALGNLGNAYQELWHPRRAATCWREAAAMRDAGDHEEAGRLEQLASGAQSWTRRLWGLRRRMSLHETHDEGNGVPGNRVRAGGPGLEPVTSSVSRCRPGRSGSA